MNPFAMLMSMLGMEMPNMAMPMPSTMPNAPQSYPIQTGPDNRVPFSMPPAEPSLQAALLGADKTQAVQPGQAQPVPPVPTWEVPNSPFQYGPMSPDGGYSAFAQGAAQQAQVQSQQVPAEAVEQGGYSARPIPSPQVQAQQNGDVTGVVAPPMAGPIPGDQRKQRAGSPWNADDYVNRTVGVESGNNPNAKNPRSSATGLGQFINSTWLNVVQKYRPDLAKGKSDAEILALRKDGALSREMTKNYATENASYLRAKGLPINNGTVYLAHFLGPVGAARVLTAQPHTPIQALVDASAYKANRAVFDQAPTAGAVVAWADRKMGQAPSGSGDRLPSLTRETAQQYMTPGAGTPLGPQLQRYTPMTGGVAPSAQMQTAQGQQRSPFAQPSMDTIMQSQGSTNPIPYPMAQQVAEQQTQAPPAMPAMQTAQPGAQAAPIQPQSSSPFGMLSQLFSGGGSGSNMGPAAASQGAPGGGMAPGGPQTFYQGLAQSPLGGLLAPRMARQMQAQGAQMAMQQAGFQQQERMQAIQTRDARETMVFQQNLAEDTLAKTRGRVSTAAKEAIREATQLHAQGMPMIQAIGQGLSSQLANFQDEKEISAVGNILKQALVAPVPEAGPTLSPGQMATTRDPTTGAITPSVANPTTGMQEFTSFAGIANSPNLPANVKAAAAQRMLGLNPRQMTQQETAMSQAVQLGLVPAPIAALQLAGMIDDQTQRHPVDNSPLGPIKYVIRGTGQEITGDAAINLGKVRDQLTLQDNVKQDPFGSAPSSTGTPEQNLSQVMPQFKDPVTGKFDAERANQALNKDRVEFPKADILNAVGINPGILDTAASVARGFTGNPAIDAPEISRRKAEIVRVNSAIMKLAGTMRLKAEADAIKANMIETGAGTNPAKEARKIIAIHDTVDREENTHQKVLADARAPVKARTEAYEGIQSLHQIRAQLPTRLDLLEYQQRLQEGTAGEMKPSDVIQKGREIFSNVVTSGKETVKTGEDVVRDMTTTTPEAIGKMDKDALRALAKDVSKLTPEQKAAAERRWDALEQGAP